MKVAMFANTDWYLHNFRREFARDLARQGYEVLLISPPGPYGDSLGESGVKWLPIPMHRRSLNPLREFRVITRLAAMLRDEQIELVHGYTLKCAVYGALAARLAKVPLVVGSVTGMGHVFTSGSWWMQRLQPAVVALFRAAFDGGKRQLVVQNRDDQAFLRAKLGLADDQPALIPGSGVDCTHFSPSQSPPDPGRPLTVLMACRLLRDKGVEEYCTAAERVIGSHGACQFLLAGEVDPGNPSSVDGDWLARRASDSGVQLLGHVPEMADLLRQCDVVVLPSYREGLPKGLVEAGACELPVVATDVPGCREVVQHGLNGLLVPPRSGVALADAILKLLSDRGLRQRMGRAGREQALARFSQEPIHEATRRLYQQLMRFRDAQ